MQVNQSIVIPILRAVPAIIFSAAASEVALRSGSLILAISVIFALEILPTLLLLGAAEPFSIPAAFFNKLSSWWSF